MRLCFLFITFLAVGISSGAQTLETCQYPEPPKPKTPEQCPIAPLGVGAWTMRPVTNVTAMVQRDNIRVYDSKPIGKTTIAAYFDPLDCKGTARIDLLDSGRSFELKQVFSDEEVKDHATLVGETVIQPALNLIGDVEVRASARSTAIMSMTIDGARFADVAKGGVVLKMEHTDARDIHPYCDCRTSLRKFLRDKIAYYEGILAGYQNRDFWRKPDDWDDLIPYDFVNYNQYMLMVTDWGMSKTDVTQCFKTKYGQMSEAEKENNSVGEYFARKGRAAASTDPNTCEMENIGDDTSCYPAIMDEMEFIHESVHHKDCKAVLNDRYSYNVENNIPFDWMKETRNFAFAVEDLDNKEPQALAETEIKAYMATIDFLKGWEEDNCEEK